MKHLIKAYISRGEDYYVAECMDISVVTQGKTLDQVVENLREAVALHLEGENLEEMGFAPHPGLLLTIELEPIANVA